MIVSTRVKSLRLSFFLVFFFVFCPSSAFASSFESGEEGADLALPILEYYCQDGVPVALDSANQIHSIPEVTQVLRELLETTRSQFKRTRRVIRKRGMTTRRTKRKRELRRFMRFLRQQINELIVALDELECTASDSGAGVGSGSGSSIGDESNDSSEEEDSAGAGAGAGAGEDDVVDSGVGTEGSSLLENLIAGWDMEDSPVFDISGNGYDGTLEFGASLAASNSAASGLAAQFDGVDDHVAISNIINPSGESLTISLLFKAESLGVVDGRLISKAVGIAEQDHYFMISTFSNNRLRLRLKAGGSTTTLIGPANSFALNTWTHVALRYDGITLKLYQDGNEIASTNKTGALNPAGTVSTRIGQNPDGDKSFHGQIDQVYIFDSALSPSELFMLSGLTPPECGNGIVEAPAEECEGSQTSVVNTNCTTEDGYAGTQLATATCNPSTCLFGEVVTGACQTELFCGDGICNGDENNSTCSADCYCGNGTVEAGDGEQCDDGNTNEDDSCSNSCEWLGGGASDILGCTHKPGPLTTGYNNVLVENPTTLLPYTGPSSIDTPGTVIENVFMTSPLHIYANNVTVRNFKIDTTGNYGIHVHGNPSNVLIEDGEIINVTSAGLYGSGFTARRIHIHESEGDAIKTSSDVTVEYSYIHHLGKKEGAHADGNQTRVGQNLYFACNNIELPAPESPGGPGSPYKSNAAFINQTHLGPIDNFIITRNWLNGGNYTVYFTDKNVGYGPPTNCELSHNRFGRNYRHGLLADHTDDLLIVGNVWDTANLDGSVPAGSPVDFSTPGPGWQQ